MKNITVLLLIIFMLSASHKVLSEECPCSLDMSIGAEAYYSAIYKESDVIFVGRIIDTLQITPNEYIAVFEEQSLIKGDVSKVKYASENNKTTYIRYVLVSDLDSLCSYKFGRFYKPYIVAAKKKSEKGNLLFASVCGGSDKYNKLTSNLLTQIAVQSNAKGTKGTK